NDGRIILLSAVLPNTKDISKWISNDENNIFQSDKRLANQRFGLLKWTKNKNINIEWFGKPVSFNNNFIEKFLPPRARSKYFPNAKNEGYASAALKLSKLGTVLLFVAQARYVVTYAKKILRAMGENNHKMIYKNINLFKSFKLACEEAGENDIFELAEYGILCHYGKISTDVRLLLEKVMREEKPKVIVSTSTLGQGVNIGISTVIFADVFMNHQERYKIDSKDFWNIAGRAGRAFTDIEGKVLYAIDENKEQWKLRKDIELANQYFKPSNMEKAKSGLLSLIKAVKVIAEKCNISFELLLQLIAENDFSKLNIAGENHSENIKEAFSWIDDTLLALDYKKEVHLDSDPSEWIDDYFRNSLAYIQAENSHDIKQSEIIDFLKARNKAVLYIAGDYNNWESIIKSAIPLSSSILIKEYIDSIKEILSIYIQSEKNIRDIIKLVKKIEKIIQMMPSTSFKNDFNKDELKIVRKQWFSGIPLLKIKESPNGHKICNEYFGMNIPWAINAIVRKLYDLNLEDEAKALEDIALFSEIGLSNKVAIKIYLSGIKSRVAALDLSQAFNDDFDTVSKKELLRLLTLHKKKIKANCSKTTLEWIKLYSKNENNNTDIVIPKFNDFKLDKVKNNIKSNLLNVRQYNDKTYLCSSDFQDMILIKSSKDLPFNEIANNSGLYFKYDETIDSWTMLSRNSKLLLEK
ncbi:MAG: helicase-related protein, partial [Candidatus Cloacimonadota bacterium]|nr:helicase-related protein [Candidatus Cloacimonadota bacterium]